MCSWEAMHPVLKFLQEKSWKEKYRLSLLPMKGFEEQFNFIKEKL